jgi:hypothetical protein
MHIPVAACVHVQVSSSDPPELRLLRPLVLEAAGFLGYTQAMNTAGKAHFQVPCLGFIMSLVLALHAPLCLQTLAWLHLIGQW